MMYTGNLYSNADQWIISADLLAAINKMKNSPGIYNYLSFRWIAPFPSIKLRNDIV